VAVAVVLAVLLTLVVVALVAWPLVRRSPEEEGVADPAKDERRELDEALQRSLAAIREIEFDHRSGHLSDADFAALDAAERAQAVELIRRLDALTPDDEGTGR
jgi:hypothetical protein